MKRVVQVVAWFFFALDVAALLWCMTWAIMASARDGESAYAMVFLILAGAFVGIGGGALVFSVRRSTSLGLGCATLVLAVPALIGLTIWLSNVL